MQFKVDIDEFWVEEEEVAHALKSYVSVDVAKQIHKLLKEKIDEFIENKAEEFSKKLFDVYFTKIEKQILEGQSMTIGYSSFNQFKGTFEQLFLKQLGKHAEQIRKPDQYFKETVNHAVAQVKQLATEQAKQLNNRYDAVFAATLITKLNEGGFLKKDAAKFLIDSGNSDA